MNHSVLIGSRAMKHWFPDFPMKEHADWDVISTSKIEGAEWHRRDFLNNARIADKYCNSETINMPNGTVLNVMLPEGLAIIKRSHLWRDLSFGKHITHFHKHLRKYFVHNDTYVERLAMTKKEFPQGNPNLMQSKEDFFDDAVEKEYDHDYLHELLAFYDEPLYKRLLRQEGMAWCEQSKWELLSDEDKLKCVAEEVYVISLERFVLPKHRCYNPKLAYFMALEKVCTTLCSGWFRDYAIDNYPEVVSLYNSDKVKNVLFKLKGEN